MCVFCVQRMLGMLEGGKRAIRKTYDAAGWGKIALIPPVDNPRNLVDFGLSVKFHKVRIRQGAQCCRLNFG